MTSSRVSLHRPAREPVAGPHPTARPGSVGAQPPVPGGPLPVLARLSISSPTDRCEQEAERVAEAVVERRTTAAPVTGRPGAGPAVQRQVEPDQTAEDEMPEGLEPDGTILPARLPGAPPAAPLQAGALGSSPGRPLPGPSRRFMESGFGHDFSTVRVHTDGGADRAARSVNAAAFTLGRDVYFRHGRYAPDSAAGRRLLAHELTHVVQQAGGDRRIHRSALHRPAIHPLPAARAAVLWRAVEAHINLRQPQRVRLYDGSSHEDFVTSAGTGRRTSRLIPHSPLPIIGKRADPTAIAGKWGLRYFTWFTPDGVGFHSNLCNPRPHRRRVVLTVDGQPRSHGCARLREAAAIRVYNALSLKDRVHIYDEPGFRSASWASSGAGTGTTGSAAPGSYTVQAGDTLSEIADRLGVPWQDLATANGITDPALIRPGQTLTIPGRATRSPIRRRSYTVRAGDTLSEIAGRLGVSWQDLATANGITDPTSIRPGQELIVPSTGEGPASRVPRREQK
jgi:LysM repeat protein